MEIKTAIEKIVSAETPDEMKEVIEQMIDNFGQQLTDGKHVGAAYEMAKALMENKPIDPLPEQIPLVAVRYFFHHRMLPAGSCETNRLHGLYADALEDFFRKK